MPGTEPPTIPLAQALEAAASAYASNEWDKAERLCRTILQVQPDSFEALNLLGIIRRAERERLGAAERRRCRRPDPGRLGRPTQ